MGVGTVGVCGRVPDAHSLFDDGRMGHAAGLRNARNDVPQVHQTLSFYMDGFLMCNDIDFAAITESLVIRRLRL